jgi:hypothetical protein
MIVACAWCRARVRLSPSHLWQPGVPAEGEPVSHGMCPACSRREEAALYPRPALTSLERGLVALAEEAALLAPGGVVLHHDEAPLPPWLGRLAARLGAEQLALGTYRSCLAERAGTW